MTDIGKKKQILVVTLIVLWAIYNLAVLLKTGFMSDDAYNSQVKGQILEQGVSLNDRILAEAIGWLKGSGRLMMVTWYVTYGLYYYTQDPIIVKTLNIIIIVIGILLFYIFSKRETDSPYVALLACLLVPVFFQFRIWHDPIMAFTFLIPAIFTLTMAALVFFQKFLDSRKIRYCIAATCLYLVTLLMYEIAYALCLIFIIIAYARNRSFLGAIKQSLPFTTVTALCVGISAFFRLYYIKNIGNSQSTYPGAEFHLDIWNVISAFKIQTFSSVPMSYFIFNRERLGLIFQSTDYIIFPIFAVALGMLLYKIGRSNTPPKLPYWIACGAVLLFASAALTSLSGHQVELIQVGYGFGYIPVYLQYFGLCIIVVSGLATISTKIKLRSSLIKYVVSMSVFVMVIAALNLGLNRAVALKMNETYKYPADLLKSALKAGLADDLKDGAFLFRTTRFPSDYTWFYRIVTGKKIELCDLANVAGYKLCIEKLHFQNKAANTKPSATGVEVIDMSNQNAWILSYNFEKKSGKTGRVIIAKVERFVRNSNSNSLIQVLVNEIKIYDLKENSIRNLSFEPLTANFLNIIETQTVDFSRIQPLDQASLTTRDIGVE
ncbi:MAG: hypothetical protein H7069_12440, partial [Phormidesmis sp. FL-bin-119]|nr:hypothetical protein [Pedobacter sp.]